VQRRWYSGAWLGCAHEGTGQLAVAPFPSGRQRRGVKAGLDRVDERTGHAFVANQGDNTVSVLDGNRGAVLHTSAVGTNPTTLAVAARTGRVFVVNRGDGTVSVLDARTGAVLRTVAVGAIRPQAVSFTNAVDVVVDERDGRAVVLNGSARDRAGNHTTGSVSVLDAGSGRLLRTVTVGRAPVAAAVDETTGRLFVVNNAPEGHGGEQNAWGWVPAELRPWLPHALPSARNSSVTVLDLARV
jgi:YVTN family beta-propeller protein